MEFVQILYNPKAGRKRKSRNFVARLVYLLCQQGEKVNIYPSRKKGDLTEFFDTFDPEGCKTIFVLGGDGTLNEVVNGMMKNKVNIPIFLAPIGTANDFAYYLGINANVDRCVKLYNEGNIRNIDVGVGNNTYFINVCGAGLFTNSVMEFDPKKKEKWGKLAYYAKGLGMLRLFKRYRLRIVKDGEELEDDFYFFLALNGVSTGGLKKIACEAVADDGLLDFVAIKAMKFTCIIPLFIRVLMGRHLRNKNIVFFKTKHVYIEAVNKDWVFGHSDLDGQHGPDLPIDISLVPKALRFFAK